MLVLSVSVLWANTTPAPTASFRTQTLVGVFDTDSDRAAEIAAKHGTDALKLDELLKNAAAVSVVVPTEYHLTIAEQCLAAGVAPLIEKPVVTDRSKGKTASASRRSWTPSTSRPYRTVQPGNFCVRRRSRRDDCSEH